ncbi:methylosome protein 50 isoform X2 [Cephus cinctus]|uniref:Methylosome protein 50 isoform X2 n=1 Tax=Cephus cinctus TaxID=211228 RepID=A0AAJ7BHM7_CEPCN|nr:methylosome protein 50 isoform X2 [Cephus cinctus]
MLQEEYKPITKPQQVDPNLNAEFYRNIAESELSPVIDPQLEFIAVYNDETAIVGATCMTSRFWRGNLWYYEDISNLNRAKATTTSGGESGITTGAFLGERDKFVVGEDSGVIKVLKVDVAEDESKRGIYYLGYACQHDDSITSLSILKNSKQIVTAGLDYCIKVWDVEVLLAVHSYNPAHVDIVTSVDAHPTNDSMFASTSLDQDILVWDIRQAKPAKRILRKTDCGGTFVAWNPLDESILTIGAQDGSISIVDVRSQNDSPLCESVVFSREIRSLCFHPKRTNLLAACSNDSGVKVFNTSNEISLIYEDNTHKDFVRGLAWIKDELISCSWDDTIQRHAIPF